MYRMLAAVLCAMLIACSPCFAFFKGGSIPTVTQNIANNVRGPGYNGNFLSNGTDTTSNVRSVHQNNSGAALQNVGVIYSGWYITGTTGEQDLPNAYTVTASVEYPVGIFTQVTWSGATSASVAAGSNTVSDLVPINIPAGAQFFVRTFVTVPSGAVWSGSGSLTSAETGESGVGLSDKTVGGTITGTYTGLRPSAIISRGSSFYRTSPAVFGDSIAAGATDGVGDGYGWGWASRASTSNTPMLNTSYTGTQLGQQVGHFARRADLITKAGITHAVLAWGVNDAGATLASLQTNINTLMAQVTAAGAKGVWTTLTPEGPTSTQAYQTVASQTASSSTVLRGQLNDWIRTTPAPMFAYVENADPVESSRNSNLWNAALPGSTYSPYMCPADVLTVGAGATTTSLTSNSVRPTQYYDFGGNIIFTSGALSGSKATVLHFTAGGAFTLNTTLSQAPASGDTFVVYPGCTAATNDGVHPTITTDVGSHVCTNDECGGIAVLEHHFVPILQAWK